jgi:hypothetical protein
VTANLTRHRPATVAVSLKPAMASVFRSQARHRMLLAGRRTGKTWLSIAAAMAEAINRPGSRVHYLAPTLTQSRAIAWDLLLTLLPQAWIKTRNTTAMEIRLRNGSTIKLGGLDHADALRGQSSNLLILDEFAFASDLKTAWQGALRPLLATTAGKSLWISTPAGADPFVRKVYDGAATNPGWAQWTLQSIQGGWIPAAEIEEARREMDVQMFRQEFLCTFEILAGCVYRQFSDENIRPVTDRGGPIVLGLDFNNHPFCGVIAQTHGEDIEVLREITLMDADTDQMAVAVRALYPGRKITVCPDPTGARRQTCSLGLTDHKILENHGFTVATPRAPWRVADKCTCTRYFIRSSDGKRRLVVDPGATRLIQSLRSLEYAEGKSIPDPKSDWSHSCDSLGYLLLAARHGLLPRLYSSGNTSLTLW